MSQESIRQIVDQFILDITEAVRGDAKAEVAQEIREKLKGFADGFGARSMKSKNATRKGRKGVTLSRPCPVPGCKETAFPRHQLVCKEHSETLERKDILMHRDVAAQPGGIWYKLGLGSHAKADRKKAKAG
jgi:hypothetical protein